MTIRELINKIAKEKPHSFTDADILGFVNQVEAEVAEQFNMSEAPQYMDNHTDLDIELLAPAPYSRLYISYVKSQIDYANEEYGSYQLNAEQHTQDFRDFVDWIVREGIAGSRNTPTRFTNVF